jgi:transcriptional regulator with XRE-family HTH domain
MKNPNERSIFAQRLRQARIAKGMTQEAMALELGLCHPCTFFWEAGRNMPKTERLPEIARMLGVSLDWLFGLDKGGTA